MKKNRNPAPQGALAKGGSLLSFGELTFREALSLANVKGRPESQADAIAAAPARVEEWSIHQALARLCGDPAAWRALRASWTRSAGVSLSGSEKMRLASQHCARLWGSAMEELCAAKGAAKDTKALQLRRLSNAFEDSKHAEDWLAGMKEPWIKLAREAMELCKSDGARAAEAWDAAVHWRWGYKESKFAGNENFRKNLPWVATEQDFEPEDDALGLSELIDLSGIQEHSDAVAGFGFGHPVLNRAMLSKRGATLGLDQAMNDSLVGVAQALILLSEALGSPQEFMGFGGGLSLALGFQSVPGRLEKEQGDHRIAGDLRPNSSSIEIWRSRMTMSTDARTATTNTMVHEWAHALDYRAGSALRGGKGFSGEPASRKNSNPISMLVSRLSGPGSMAARSLEVDQREIEEGKIASVYWSSPTEIFARAVEAALCSDMRKGGVYPTADEAEWVASALPAIGLWAINIGALNKKPAAARQFKQKR